MSASGARRHRVEAARLALPSGRSSDWLKLKNPATPAVKREEEEEEEDWGIKGGDDLTGGALMHNSM